MSKANEHRTRLVSVVLILVGAITVSTHHARASNIGVQDAASLRFATGSQADGDAVKDRAAIIGAARTIYICSLTAFLKTETLENELLKRGEFNQSGLLITKDAKAADLVITIRRANFTTVYPYDVVDPKTKFVVATGKVNSLFGTAAGKIAKGFMKQVKEARTSIPAKPKS